MKLITWNCCGRFRQKAQFIAGLKPDVLAVQEVEAFQDARQFSGPTPTYAHREVARPIPKSIGMFSYTGCRITFEKLLPGVRLYHAEARSFDLRLMVVWTSPTSVPGRQNYRQLHEALESHVDWLNQGPTVILGDLNMNLSYKGDGMPTLLERLTPMGFVSAYHHYFDEPFGHETRPTHFHLGKAHKPFHLDYCFLSVDLVPKLTSVNVGTYEDWRGKSDHVPLIVDLGID